MDRTTVLIIKLKKYLAIFALYLFSLFIFARNKVNMPIITRKIELEIDKDGLNKEELTEQWQYLRQINNHLYEAANRISSHCFFNDEYEKRLRYQMPEYRENKKSLEKAKKKKSSDEELIALKAEKAELDKLIMQKKKDFFCMTERNTTYRVVSEEFRKIIPSDILANLNQNIVKHYGEVRKEIQQGNRTLSVYKKGMPIPFSFDKEIPFVLREKDKGIDILLKWFNNICFKLYFGRDRSNNRVIVERLIESAKLKKVKGEDYVVSNSSIQLVEKDHQTKIFLLLSLDIPLQKRALNKDLVLGVDLGINYPLYLATNQDAYFRQHIGDRDSFLNERLVFQRRFKELQRLQCTQGGRGRKSKLQPLDQLKEKERNWVRTKNHIFSREVIKFALKLGAGTINLEMLKNIGKDKTGEVKDKQKFILRNWSYFELQTMIQYKAKMEGIDVNFVKSAYTSQHCNCCGFLGERIEQAHFHCLNPECPEFGKDINADFNGARNIAKSKQILKD